MAVLGAVLDKIQGQPPWTRPGCMGGQPVGMRVGTQDCIVSTFAHIPASHDPHFLVDW